MSNQAPTISGSSLAAIREASASDYLKTGTLSFADADAGDTISVAMGGQAVVYRSISGIDLTARLTEVQVARLASAFSFATEALNSNSGSRTWTYALPDAAVDFLGAGEQITVISTIAVSDQSGGTTTKDVVVTLTGVNDAPAILATAEGVETFSASVAEASGRVADPAVSSRQGSVTFKDLDASDTHTVSVVAKARPYVGTLTASIASDAANGAPGAVVWTYSVADKTLDYLSAGQQVTQVYTLTVSDGKGGTAQQDVTVLLTGANDGPSITGSTGASLAENTAATYTRTGTMIFSDVDLADRLTTSIASQTLVWKTAAGVDITSKLTPDQITTLVRGLSLSLDELNSNRGSTSWTFDVAEKSIDFLGRFETLTLKTIVIIDDHHGGVATKDIVISVTGGNDAPVIEGLTASDPNVKGRIVEAPVVPGSTAVQTAKGVVAFSDFDVTDVHTLTVKALGAGYLGTFSPVFTDTVAGTYGSAAWTYTVADKALNYLASGQVLTQTYALTISDGKGGGVTQNILVELVGANDTPVFNGVETATTVYESCDTTLKTQVVRSGTIIVSDSDATDHLSITTSDYVIHYFDASGNDLSSLPASQLTAAQTASLGQVQGLASYLVIVSTASGSSGNITWNYSVDPETLTFLNAGESVKISSSVIVQDLDPAGVATGSPVVQPITVTFIGTNEQISVKDYVASILEKTFLQAIPVGFTIGNQIPVSNLLSLKSLTSVDGIVLTKTFLIEVVKDGATFDGIDFRGMQILVKSNNVTFVNCIFDNSGSRGQETIRAVAGYSNLTIDHSTFDGLKLNSPYPSFISSEALNTALTNNIFMNAPSDAVRIDNGTIVGNYFTGSGYYPNAHADAIWISKTTGPVVIENNVIDWRTPADAATGTNNAIRISGERGNVDNVTIQNNVLLGANYTITVTAGATWTHTADQVGTVTNVAIVDNVIGLGIIGSIDFVDRPGDLEIRGNEGLNGTGLAFGGASVADLPSLTALNVVSGGIASGNVRSSSATAYVIGGPGSDYMSGGIASLNVFQGGLGRDFINGGVGTNLFVYKSAAGSNDLISHFNDATDKFDFASLIELGGLAVSATDWLWLGTSNFTGTALQIRYSYNTGLDRTVVSVDINGDLVADLQVQVSGNHAFTTDQFILERAHPTTSILGALWSSAGLDAASNSLTLPFAFADAPLVVRDEIVALQDSDGTLLPISGAGIYKFSNVAIVASDGSPLVDDLFYNTKYRAELGGLVDAEADYASIGWAAGRDPNALFSSSGYLAAHPDVVAAGMSPLEHWATIGWQLGYDPGPTFDVKTYLLRYKDVLTAGVDPLTDYLTAGKAAGRIAYGAIGDAVQETCFDAQYYLLVHPEVASSGLDPYEHYLAIGWHQGFNPNAFFDVAYYLSQNPSVAASGVDPLQDFMNGGWRQGNNPSASFDVALYLAANPDVAASGVNPLLQFLQYGANEGRLAFSIGSAALTNVVPIVTGEIAVVTSSIAFDGRHGVLENDTDADGNTLSVKAVAHDGFAVGTAVPGAFGDLILNADGSYSYTVTNTVGALGVPLLDRFNYVVTDGKGANSSAELVVRVDRLGVVQDDTASASLGTGAHYAVGAASGVLANDSDLDGALQVVSINGSTAGQTVNGLYGTLVMAADGSYSYVRTSQTLPANAMESFAYSVSDGLGGEIRSALLTIKVAEANTVATISGDTSSYAFENQTTPVGGLLSFSDADVGDKLVVTSEAGSFVYLDTSGADRTSLLSASAISGLKAGFVLSGSELGSNTGTLGWSYAAPSTAFDFLGQGETAKVSMVVKVDDGHGGTVLKDVVVTVAGTNDKPVFATQGAASVVAETAGRTGSSAVVTQQGTISFSDLDLTDAHAVSVSMGGAGYAGAVTASIVSDTTGGGQGVVGWTFSATDKALDFLADGQRLDQTYTLTLSDGKGGIVRQNIVVTLVGSQDLPVITGSTGAAWYEGSAANHVKTGVLKFLDPDLTDHVTTSIGAQNVSFVTASGTDMTSSLSASQVDALKAAFSMPVGDLGSNKGSAVWSYTIADAKLDFLGQNDVVKVVTRVQVDDGHGGTTAQDVTMTLKGVNDAPAIVSPATSVVTGTVSETAGISGSASVHAATGSFQFADADLSDTHLLRVKANGTGYLGTFTPVVTQDTTGGGTGTVNWTFQVADKALDGLAAGQTVTQIYSVTVNDGKAGSVTQQIAMTLTGASDQFVFATPSAKALPNFAAGDTLAVNASAFAGGLSAGALDASWFSDTAGATVAGHGQFFQDAAQKLLYWDADGTGSRAPVTIATFATAQFLHHSDIMVV